MWPPHGVERLIIVSPGLASEDKVAMFAIVPDIGLGSTNLEFSNSDSNSVVMVSISSMYLVPL